MNYNILVTGGAGYIGSVLVPELLAAGNSVTVVDNFLYGQNSLAAVCADPKFNVVRADVRNEAVMRPLVTKSDLIIPLAALVGAPICSFDPVGAETINHASIIQLLGFLSRDQIVLMPTTNSAYGSGGEGNFCTEESQLRPISKYAIDKVEVERQLMQHGNVISYRLATVFGFSPRMRIDLLVNDFTYRAVRDRFVVLFESSFKRNYIHVRDVSRVFLHGMKNFDTMKGQIFNVGLSDANLSKKELCERIQKQLPEFVFTDAVIGKDPDQRNYIVSNEKIKKTGFEPKFSIDMGIQELIKGYQMVRSNNHSNI
jgi:nucleoside-diphosphate-sugar epimerase